MDLASDIQLNVVPSELIEQQNKCEKELIFEDVNNKPQVIHKETETYISKPCPVPQNIRPIVPVQATQIAGSSLKPSQPKPTILPPPTINLCFEDLEKVSKKRMNHNLKRTQ